MSGGVELPYEAWLTALLSLPRMGPGRLSQLLEAEDAEAAWVRVRSGDRLQLDRVGRAVIEEWRATARSFDVAAMWHATRQLGVHVAELGAAGYPMRLLDDIEPPMLLFRRGRPIGDHPTVAIVGTRKCTSYGQRVAFELGQSLADAGIAVVSGLALGIDAAAHRGALAANGAPPIGVVGSGLDVVYPKRNAQLWEEVAQHGTLVSESPPGTKPEPWRFPARNRIIAGLADAVVVVESHESGGSLLTVDEAQLRDVVVGAVPGPITSGSASGTNRLLADGAAPVLGVDDVFGLIGHVPPRDAAEPVDGDVVPEVLQAMGWGPTLLEQLCLRLQADPLELAAKIELLVAAGRCTRSGPWIERVR
jgi:DNA processing protein